MDREIKVRVSRYMSYLLRHNPQGLRMNRYGFVDLDELIKKVKERFHVNREFILEIVEGSERRRFEVVDNKIRALYGHTIPVVLTLKEDGSVKSFFTEQLLKLL